MLSCSICGKTFKNQCGLSTHLSRSLTCNVRSPETPSDMEKHTFHCPGTHLNLEDVFNTSNIKSSYTEISKELGVRSVENKKITSGIEMKPTISSRVLEEATKEGNFTIGMPDDYELFTCKFMKVKVT